MFIENYDLDGVGETPLQQQQTQATVNLPSAVGAAVRSVNSTSTTKTAQQVDINFL